MLETLSALSPLNHLFLLALVAIAAVLGTRYLQKSSNPAVATVGNELAAVEMKIKMAGASELHTLAANFMDTSAEQAVIAAAKADIAKAEASIASKLKALTDGGHALLAMAAAQSSPAPITPVVAAAPVAPVVS